MAHSGFPTSAAAGINALRQSSEVYTAIYSVIEEVAELFVSSFELVTVPTTFSNHSGISVWNAKQGPGPSSAAIQVYRGGGVSWMSRSAICMAPVLGGCKLNVYLEHTNRAPNLDLELATFDDKVLLYVNPVPRVDLVADQEYLRRYYQRDRNMKTKSFHQIALRCIGDRDFRPFQSKSLDTRVYAGPVGLLYELDARMETVAKARQVVLDVARLWLEFARDGGSGVRDERESVSLKQRDKALAAWPRRDPGNTQAAAVFGPEAVEEMLKVLCRDPAVLQ